MTPIQMSVAGTVPRKKHKVVRWFVLAALAWIATIIYFLISTEIQIVSHATGGSTVPVEPSANVELEQGDQFGLTTSEGTSTACTVTPDSGQPREYRASVRTGVSHHSRLPIADQAWFTGNATISCEKPVSFIPPERYAKTGTYVLSGLIGTSSLLMVIGFGQLYRRTRRANRMPADGEES